MEDYDQFVQLRFSQLRTSEEGENIRPPPSPSLICFYGRPILSPLLSEEQRKEMQQYKDAAKNAAGHRQTNNTASKLAYVQTLLHSVQLRKTPTLEELLQETKSPYSHTMNGELVSKNHFQTGTKDSLVLSLPPVKKREDGLSFPQVTSSVSSAFFTSNMTPHQSDHVGCTVDQHDSQKGPQPSPLNDAVQHSLSSGYVTSENIENTICVSGMIDERNETGMIDGRNVSHGLVSTEEDYSMDSFFLHSTSNTISKRPEIISHPPIDGEELERSGQESSFCNHFIAGKAFCYTSFQENSVTCYDSAAEKLESSNVESREREDNRLSTAGLKLDKDHVLDRSENLVSSSQKSGISVNTELSEAFNTRCAPQTQLHSQHKFTEKGAGDNHVDEAKPSEEPYRLSLPALLKKSQEYRRRQRMLRNKAKNPKIQERTVEPKTRPVEYSFSDKENDESPCKGSVTAEQTKSLEKRCIFAPSGELSWDKTNLQSESKHLMGGLKTMEMSRVEEETTVKNNKLNNSQEAITEPKAISAFIQEQPVFKPVLTDFSPNQDSFYMTTVQRNNCPQHVFQEGKCYTIPAPNFCIMSPVHSRNKGSITVQQSTDGEAAKKGKILVNTGSKEDHSGEDSSSQDHQNSHTLPLQVPSTLDSIVQDSVTSISFKSSEHIDQLEVISDLESTMKVNIENNSQTASNTQSDLSFKGDGHSEQRQADQQMQLHLNDCDYLKDELGNYDAESSDGEYRELPRRQSSDNSKHKHEGMGPEANITEAGDGPLIMDGKGKCRKQQPPAKCILSTSQWMRIPDPFRIIPSEIMVPSNKSVLSDTSNRPVDLRDDVVVDDDASTHSTSLNRSYDVDTPSDLWLLEGTEFKLGTNDHLQEKDLTPDNGSAGQGGVPKVKRRLLMQATEETKEGTADTNFVVRPSSSTPKAGAWQCEDRGSLKNKQEQLKQAHAAQIRAMQDEHKRQEKELLQALAKRFQLLQSVSFPCSVSSSRLEDSLTFSGLSQPSSPLPKRYRPLLAAAVKGFLTRRLLRTEKVARLKCTIRDSQQFLRAQLLQSPGRTVLCSRQDLLLQERVTLQLRAARYEVYDIFFSLSTRERMQLISWDRDLVREKELRRQSGHKGDSRGKGYLSAATQKSLERKREMMLQKKVAEGQRQVVTKTGRTTGFSAKQTRESKRGQFRANPLRVPKSTYSTRPR